ncbi:nicotinamidase [Shewanella fodinae]|jgi:nicotinamidase/pyrazinamidase|uniref:nicotinamidase n=1 Tax=Shewanella fodinae TaxID=552357 RepID=A0A4R2FG13_9GAMM|nr:nicotinamidase [Shewanella fodinae]MCL2906514.1 nicotinamidase [Shewanella fodinae]TCN86323.1 nicotinamidase/pyrazinamidase [Shewanella fodinae]GGY93793.1 nicotinamidase [Shewanella fodinae]
MIAAFDVDAQRTFTPLCPHELPVVGGDEIAAELNAQAQLAQLRIASKDAHCPTAKWVVASHAEMLQPLDYPDADLTWVRHAEPGTEGFELIPGLPAPAEYDFLVYKGVETAMHPYGACYHDLAGRISTGVIEWLKCHQVDTVLVGGLALDFCVKTTALQLAAAGFNVYLNLAACRAISETGASTACEEMRQAGITLVKDSQVLAAKLQGSH